MFKEFDRRYEAITSLVNKCDLQQHMLLQKVERVLSPFDKFMSRRDIIQNFERLREYTAEVESKISNEWYNHVGLIEKLKYHFSEQINSNKEDIVKILERLQNKEEEEGSGSGIWRGKTK